MVTKTPEEWANMDDSERKAHLAAEEVNVFGDGFKKVKGVPQEQGLGAHGRETANHFAAIRKHEGEEAYQTALAEIWKRDPDRAKKLSLPKAKQAA